MKIAHVVDSMEVGGAETLVAQMCRLQREQGHDPSVYAIGPLGPLGEQMCTDGFVVRPHVGRRLMDSTRNFYRLFKELQPDVVHLHNPTPTIYAGAAARKAGVPSIVSTRHSLVAPPRKLMVETKYAIASTFCDWVVGICDATASNVKNAHSAPARKVVRVYNGAAPMPRTAQAQLPAKSGFTLVYVGRLAPVKNHGLLLHAFAVALQSRSDLRLWMVGDGSERDALEHLAAELGVSEQITFWGQQMDVAPFLSAADGFIMSSQSEGLPMSLLQAFSLGLPAIVTDVGGMAEAVRLAQAGYIVPPTSTAEMAAAILRLADNDAERAQFAHNGLQAFQKHFSLATMVDAYMELYRNTPRMMRAERKNLQPS